MNFFQRAVIEPFEKLYEKILLFLPNFLTSILLLLTGFIVGAVLKAVFLRFFRALKIDKYSERFGMGEVLGKGGIQEPLSSLLSRVIGWIVVFTFLIISIRALELPTVERLLETFFLYLPNVFVAAAILFFGYLLSNFFGRTALIASVNAGVKFSGLVGKAVKFTVLVLSATMALEQLGIGRDTVIVAFAIIFGGVVLALALAFGLGARDIAKNYLEKKMKDEERDEIDHV